MGCQNRPLNLPPCPVCGEGSAWMGSTTWYPFTGHACSDKCGEAAKLALLALRETAEYQRMRDTLNDWQQRIHDAEHKAIAAALQEPPEMTPLEQALREAVEAADWLRGKPTVPMTAEKQAALTKCVKLIGDHADELMSLVGGQQDPETALLEAVGRFVKSIGGGVVVAGGIMIEREPVDSDFRFSVCVKCVGRRPPSPAPPQEDNP